MCVFLSVIAFLLLNCWISIRQLQYYACSCVCVSVCDSVSVIELLDKYKAISVLCLFVCVCVLSVIVSLLFRC